MTDGAKPDPFAPAQFRDLTDAEKLNGPAFEPLQSGVTLGTLAAQRAKINARRRALYAAHRGEMRAKQRAHRAAHPSVRLAGERVRIDALDPSLQPLAHEVRRARRLLKGHRESAG